MHKQQSGVGQPIPNQSIISCCIKILAQRRKRLSIPRWLFGRRGAPWESLQTNQHGLGSQWLTDVGADLNLCNMRIWKSSGVYLSCRRFGPPLCQLHWGKGLLYKACCIAYLPFNHHLSTILLPSNFQHIWFWNATPPKESAKICKAAAFLLSLFSLALARTWLSAQDLQVTDPDILFKLLDDGDKQLTAESFLQLQHLQYAASSTSTATLHWGRVG